MWGGEAPSYARRMPLRVLHSGEELVLSDERALAALYRGRRLQPSDLVWHPARKRWVRIDAFLFLDPSDPAPRGWVFTRRANHRSGDGGTDGG